MSRLLVKNVDIIYFFYGLAYLILGIVLLTQIRATGKSKYKLLDILWLLAAFAIIHGINEFIEMFVIIKGEFYLSNILQSIILFISFIFLFSFGYILVNISGKKIGLWLPILITFLYLALPLLTSSSFTTWNISARYFFGFSGSILSFIGLYFYSTKESEKLKRPKKYLFISSIAFFMYGIMSGLIVAKADFFPASIINNSSFISLVGIPPQLFRTFVAISITMSMWQAINIFNLEKKADRIHVLEKLKFERDRAKNYLKIAGVIMVAIDKDGKVILINKKGTDILGYSEKEIIGKDWFDNFLPKTTKTAVKTTFNKLIAGNIKFVERYENPIINKEGLERIILWHNTIIKDKTGNTIGTLSSGEDITVRKIAEEELKKIVEKLKLTLEETVHVLASIVETKDSYTADHQKRVAELASAIAKEIGLSKQQVEGVYVSAILHDIGKLFIPTEILNRPNRLTELEYSLIKTHSQFGYDILKSVDFPWPIADIIVQHHERINGSGYPNGIKGDNLMLEAKILAVADVVEAISSHRPYRPSLGLEAALNEISQNSGILYDKKIVETCLMLFNKNYFKFKNESNNLVKLI